MKYIGHWLAIQSFKHDGNIHRLWDRGLVLDNNEDYVVVATKRAKVTEANGRKWFTREPAVTIFSKKEWWNVICMIKNNGICYYCNIASPCVIDKSLIKYIDYDLDAKLYPSKETRTLDEKEYANNKNFYHYDAELDKVLKYSLEKVTNMMKDKAFPFDDEKIKEYYQTYLEETSKK